MIHGFPNFKCPFVTMIGIKTTIPGNNYNYVIISL